jgi:hypothetical protein
MPKSRRSLSFFVLLLAAPARGATLELRGEPVVAIKPGLQAAGPSLLPSLSDIAAWPGGVLEADRDVRVSLSKAAIAQGQRLDALVENFTFAQQNGAKLVLLPFDGVNARLGLNSESVASFMPGYSYALGNWRLIGPDRWGLERAGASPHEAERVTALALAPIVGHELGHLRMRTEVGIDFPANREEEILTHLAQADAYDQAMRAAGNDPRLEEWTRQAFLHRHTAGLRQAWAKGWDELVEHVVKLYGTTASLNDDPARHAAVVRSVLEAGKRGETFLPAYQIPMLERAVSFWTDPKQVADVASYLAERIAAAHRRYDRKRSGLN